MINIETIKVDVAGRGHITNSYLVYDDVEKEAVLIDPGYEAEKIIKTIVMLNLNIKYIVITHGHGDHIGALKKVCDYAKCPVLVHKQDYDMLTSKVENYSKMQGIKIQDLSNCNIVKVEDGFSFKVGILNFSVIHTPGHTCGGICLHEKTSGSLFTGDTIFANCYGRCDLETGNFIEMVNSLKKIFDCFHDITIYPGHGGCANIDYARKSIKILLGTKGVSID